MVLQIKDLKVRIGQKQILQHIDLDVKAGEVHVIMGLNGTGKSTLLKALAGSYECESEGRVFYKGEELLSLAPHERAAKGLFMSFQNPIEIEGLNSIYFLKTALSEQMKFRGEEPLKAPEFMKKLKEKMAFLEMDEGMLNRSLNVGFSGGEKKRFEILQMMMLNPELILLDEIDSGLDIDALKIVAKGVNAMRDGKRAIVIVTHYSRLLEYIDADFVHILDKGIIAQSGTAKLAFELEEQGYEQILHTH